METRWRLGASIYFALQGASGVLWWAILLAFPAARELFWPRFGGLLDDRGLLSFALPDVVGFIVLSFAVAYALVTNHKSAWTLLCLHVGALGYATLFCINLAFATRGETILPALLMSPALAATVFWMHKLRPSST